MRIIRPFAILLIIMSLIISGCFSKQAPTQITASPNQTAASTNFTQITENIKSRIVQIALITNQSYTSAGNVTIIGTGFLLNNDGYIITAAHYIPFYVVGHPIPGDTGPAPPNPKLVIVVTSYQNGNPPVFPPPTNDCEVIAFDRGRDLVLLKIIPVVPGTPPPPFIAFSNGTHEFIDVGNAPLITDNVASNTPVAITGYSVNQTVPETITGHVMFEPLRNYYTTDIVTDNKTKLDLSGSPVYSVRTGDIIGILIGSNVVIPSRYISELFNNKDTVNGVAGN
ncbi:MAG: serine protease [Dehalococcoidales bacterium]|nr:serine protease [Dehalococcoidales bacterium]